MTSQIPKKILLAQKNIPLRSILLQKLSTEGFLVIQATTHEEILQTIQQDQPHLLILDTDMSLASCVSILKHIQEHHWHILSLILDQQRQEEQQIELKKAGYTQYILKSEITLKHLIQKIGLLLAYDTFPTHDKSDYLTHFGTH